MLLTSIRKDYARPNVHARNLFHASILIHDSWQSLYAPDKLYSNSEPLFCETNPEIYNLNNDVDISSAIAFGSLQLLQFRFEGSPNQTELFINYNDLINQQLASEKISSDSSGKALGEALAQCIIEFGLTDQSNEVNDYQNIAYTPTNTALNPESFGNPNLINLDRWQPLSINNSIDQSGNQVGNQPQFLGAEWGNVLPFALEAIEIIAPYGYPINIYDDTPNPPSAYDETLALYQWGFSLVSVWSSHLDPNDETLIDISPASIGNNANYPSHLENYQEFYNFKQGGDSSQGHPSNPHTSNAYQVQQVKRADYTRVLAEFWADGPDSETPPGHWFVILNAVSDHQLFDWRNSPYNVASELEWEAKSYFSLGAAMHDAAIAAWSLKAKYDYIRPISAIRAMAELGQSTDPLLINYHPQGLPIIDGFIESVSEQDPLAGNDGRHIGKIKLKAWRGGGLNLSESSAGVDWILAANWWPYQRPSFVTPPFAGYISGHSTFSSAAAKILSLLTGDPFFPGGKSEFLAPKNNFLQFERGPSSDIRLEWATYKDAADQCGLSRIWGGIHPPADDIPGRILGEKIGAQALKKASLLWFN